MNYFAYCNTAHKLLKYVILRRNTVSYLYLVLRVKTSNTGHYLVLQKTCFCLALRKRFPTRHNNEMVQKHHPHCCTRNQITLIITSRFQEGDLALALWRAVPEYILPVKHSVTERWAITHTAFGIDLVGRGEES